MSTPERPLTRRQLKELRQTGQLPVVTPDAERNETPPPAATVSPAQPSAPSLPSARPQSSAAGDSSSPTPITEVPSGAATEKSAAQLSSEGAAAGPSVAQSADGFSGARPAGGSSDGKDGSSAGAAPTATPSGAPQDGSRPLTRRQARMQRTNTISVPEAEPVAEAPGAAERPAVNLPAGFTDAFAPKPDDGGSRASAAPGLVAPAAPSVAQTTDPAQAAGPASAEDETPKVGASFGAAVFEQAEERQRREREAAEREAQRRRQAKTTVVDPEPIDDADGSETFAEAFQRSVDAGGSATSGTSLILNDMPGTASLSAPVTATGELLITSSHVLPAGLSSRGAAAGTTDGKDIDATLLDGEMPLHSSPTPIAASSAISTSKAPGDVIRPPQREKNQGLMLTLGITAGILGAALVGVIIYALMTGVIG